MNAWGIWCNEKVSRFDFRPAVAAGCAFAVGQMNTGWKKYNPNFAVMVQKAYDAGIRNIGGVYRVHPNEYQKMVDLLVYLQYGDDGKFDGNFPIIKEIFEQVKYKHMQFIIIEFGDWWLSGETFEQRRNKRVSEVHYGSGANSIINYLRDHIRGANAKIDDRVIPMWSKWTIDNAYPELKGLFAGEMVSCDNNVHGSPKPLSSYSLVPGMTRPSNPMSVSYGSDWRFCRWANSSYITPDFDGAIGFGDYHGSNMELSAYTGQPVNVPDLPDDDPDDEPGDLPDIPTPGIDIRPGLIEYLQSMSEAYERISVECIGLKHLTDDYIEQLEEE